MADTTVIRDADWIVAWDEDRQHHRYLRNADLAFTGDRIVQVGGRFAGPAQRVIDGRGLCLLPGLIDLHSHPMSEAMNKGFAEDTGNPRLGMSALYDYMPVYRPDPEGMLASAEVAYAELLLSGVTTLVDLSTPYPGWIELIVRSGLRAILAPMFRSARWYTPNGHEVRYEWAEDGGRSSFGQALAVVDRALGHGERLSAMLSPAQIDTCTPALLRDSRAAAEERGLALTIHAAQSLVEFAEITRRHGMTPIQWLDHLGLLGPRTIVAHAIFIDSHSWILWDTRRDLEVLAASGASVAHCPNVFLRHGMLLEDFGRYRRAGVNLGIGTDTFPHNMLEEIRAATLLGRVPARHFAAVDTATSFEAATLGGARALGRSDIGRLAAGAKADVVVVDLTHPAMRPVRDPLRSLVFAAAERAVRDVFVDGVAVVADHAVLTLDHAGAGARLEQAACRAERAVPALDRARRTALELAPLSLPLA